MTHSKRLVFSKKSIIIVSIFTVVLASLITGVFVYQNNVAKDSSGNRGEKPSFQTVLPNGVSIEKLGGWARVSPPKSDPVYSYNDKIGDVAIKVSQQPLPSSLTGNVNSHVADIAKQFNATAKIEAGDTTVHTGISAKGPQSAIFTKKNLLILIVAEKKIDDTSWKKYVDSLR